MAGRKTKGMRGDFLEEGLSEGDLKNEQEL